MKNFLINIQPMIIMGLIVLLGWFFARDLQKHDCYPTQQEVLAQQDSSVAQRVSEQVAIIRRIRAENDSIRAETDWYRQAIRQRLDSMAVVKADIEFQKGRIAAYEELLQQRKDTTAN